MGKKVKVGKARKDHFYSLAKAQGFRARSAFKLTQLGNKLNLFKDVSFVLDLCAAPGGWMQVSRQAVPMTGHVFGVDLAPIKPINGCTAIQADITTSRCESLLEQAFRENGCADQKMDLVLHDGAPNVGSSWDKDAYVQNELVLKALFLTTKYLRHNGTFVTKVFRSADYLKLMYVFQQLFSRVQATKPSSSRNVSAEIFVVCQGYQAPTKISADLFNINAVFEAVEAGQSRSDSVTQSLVPVNVKQALTSHGLQTALKSSKKRNRSGYEDGDDFRCCNVESFVYSGKPAELLVLHNKIVFDPDNKFDTDVRQNVLTTEEIVNSLEDLKLLSKNELQRLLKWRTAILKQLINQEAEVVAEIEKKSPIVELAPEEIERSENRALDEMLQKEAKTKLKELRKMKAKLRKFEEKTRVAASVFDGAENDPLLFSNAAESLNILDGENPMVDPEEAYVDHGIIGGDIYLGEDDDKEVEDTEQLIENKDDYISILQEELDEYHSMLKHTVMHKKMVAQEKAKKETRRQKVYSEWAQEMKEFTDVLNESNMRRLKEATETEAADDSDFVSETERPTDEDQGSDSASDDNDAVTTVPTVPKINTVCGMASSANDDEEDIDSGFNDTTLSDEERTTNDSEDIDELDDSELPLIPLNDKKRRQLKRAKETLRREKIEAKKAKKEAKLLGSLGGSIDSTLQRAAEGTLKESTIKVVKPSVVVAKKPETLDEIAEVQALGSLMIQKSSRMDLMDGTYHRYAFDDATADLPEWFVEEDSRVRVVDLPICKELYSEYRKKLKDIAERPIRRVVEAKARNKKRVLAKLDKIKKQISNVADNRELNERGKAEAITKLSKRAMSVKNKKSDKSYTVVGKRGSKTSNRPKNKQASIGKTVTVDRRLKSDKRGLRAVAKRSKKRGTR